MILQSGKHEGGPDYKVRTAPDPFVWIVFVAIALKKNRTNVHNINRSNIRQINI